MLQVLDPTARRVVGVSDSRIEVQRARATPHGSGLAHCVLQQGDLHAMTAGSADFDAIVLDRLFGDGARPEERLADAARAPRPGGRPGDRGLRGAGGAERRRNPLVALRSWLAGSGLRCARIRPVDMGTSHLLVAVGAPEQGQAAA